MPASLASDVDLFSDEVLADPYPAHTELRELGPAVHLPRYDVWAVPRHADVRWVLGHDELFSSVDSVGLEPELNRVRRGTIIASDPPDHDRLRRVLSERLAPRALHRLREEITERADRLVRELVTRRSFDAVGDLAAAFPLHVVADLIGLGEEPRRDILRFADAAFNTFGPLNDRTRSAVPVSQALFASLTAAMARDKLRPGGFGATVYEAVDRGDLAPEEAIPLLRAYMVASMDTTINAIGNCVWFLAERPDLWARLQGDRSLVPRFFEESVRVESPVQAFFRRAVADVDIDGVAVPAGGRVMLLFGSANRDPRRWTDPDVIDLERQNADHVGFGYGVHGCAGQGLARIEAHAVLGALLDQVGALRLAGQPVRRLNNVIRGLAALPVVVEPVAD